MYHGHHCMGASPESLCGLQRVRRDRSPFTSTGCFMESFSTRAQFCLQSNSKREARVCSSEQWQLQEQQLTSSGQDAAQCIDAATLEHRLAHHQRTDCVPLDRYIEVSM